MVDIDNFTKVSKVTWIRKLISKEAKPWAILFSSTVCNVNEIIKLGPEYCLKCKINNLNEFWIDTFKAWVAIYTKEKITKNMISNTPLWFNSKLSDETLYIPSWKRKGIYFIGDLLNVNNEIMTKDELAITYNLSNVNYLEHFRVKLLVKRFIKKIK